MQPHSADAATNEPAPLLVSNTVRDEWCASASTHDLISAACDRQGSHSGLSVASVAVESGSGDGDLKAATESDSDRGQTALLLDDRASSTCGSSLSRRDRRRCCVLQWCT